jgi:transcriptional regulator with XRE-family HTH domain
LPVKYIFIYRYKGKGGINEMQGKVIRYARQSLGFTQAQLARLLNSTQLSVCKWENDNQTPSSENMRRLKQVLGLDEDSIIEIETLLLNERHKRLQERLFKQAAAV